MAETDPPPADSAPEPKPPADAPAFDAANAAFDGIAEATGGGATPQIDDAALNELLKLANFDQPAGAASGVAASPTPAAPAMPAGDVESPELPDTAGFNLPDFQQVINDAAASSIDLLRDVELNVKIELGRARMVVEDVLKLAEGSVVELDKLAGDPVDVFVNDRLVARGEVLVLNDNFCVRVNEIVATGREEAA